MVRSREGVSEGNKQPRDEGGKPMVPSEVMLPTFQRMEEVMEDLDALDWELSQIALHPDLPVQLVSEAEENIAQARRVVQQVVSQVQTIMLPWACELAALKAAQEAVLHAFCEKGTEQHTQASPVPVRMQAASTLLTWEDHPLL